MNVRRLWLRAFWRRIVREWRGIGGFRRAIERIAEVRVREGWRGVAQRFDNLRQVAHGGTATSGSGVPARPARLDAAPLPGVMLVGHPYRVTGVGEVLRQTAGALEAAGIPFHIRDAFGAFRNDLDRLPDFAHGLRLDDGSHWYRANIFCLNADEMEPALGHLGLRFFQRSYNIGCWWWELPVFPRAWRHAFDCVNEVWAQSHFVHAAISRDAPVPVTWVPQTVEPGPADPAVARALGVPADRFSFLFFFDFQSFVARKNPQAVIEAFKRAFPGGGEACLVIKTNGMKQRPREFQDFLSGIGDLRSRVLVIDQVLSNAEMKGLIGGCDCFVSLHRSEGFGFGLAEAMYFGKPVIATGYSGNLDFMTPDNSCLVHHRLIPVREGEYPFWQGQLWAEPDVEQAAHWMRRLYEDAEFRRQIGERAGASIRTLHSASAVGAKIADRLHQLGCV